jgi:uncharacterized protein (UPF0248 family)
MPPAGKAPLVDIITARFGKDLNTLVGSHDDADVELRIGGRAVPAHRVVLCAASELWNGILTAGVHPAIVLSMTTTVDQPVYVELNPSLIGYNTLLQCLEYWYGGMAEILMRHPLLLTTPVAHTELAALEDAAKHFEATPLLEAVKNARDGRSELNPSIGTHQSDATGARLVQCFLGRQLFADAQVELQDGRKIPVHRAILRSRSAAIRGLFACYEGPLQMTDAAPDVALAALQ